jgi:hypothetical protein
MLDNKVTRFNKIYDVEKKLNKYYYTEQEIAKDYSNFIKEYNSKTKE